MDFVKDAFSRKRKIMSLMPYLPKIMPRSKKVVLEFRMVDKPHGKSWRDVHEIGEKAEYQPVKDDDDEMIVENDDIEITCQRSYNDKSKESQKLKALFFYTCPKYTAYFELDWTEKADESLVTLSVKQSKHQVDIKFRTHFLDQVDTPPQEASAATGEVSTSKFRSANIQEQELLNLALDVPSSKYTELCTVLGVSYNGSQAILAIHQRDFTASLIQVLCEWKDRQRGDTDCRNGIAAALRDVNLDALGDNFSRGGYHPQEATPTGNIEDKELVNLACDVPSSKYTELCIALGVSYSESRAILANHQRDFTNSLIAVFCQWKNRQRGGTDCRNVIAKALRDVKLDEHVDKMSTGGYLPQEAAPTGDYLNQEAAPTGNIEDKELVNLACDVPQSKYTELCTALGVSLNPSQTILDRHYHFTNSLIAVFREWKKRQRGGTDCRNGIATALRDVQMDALGEKMSRGGYLPQEAAPTDTTETSSMESGIASQRPKSFTSVDVSNSKARVTEESREQDFDVLLKTVAKQIDTDIGIYGLGGELGVKIPDVQRYIQTSVKYQDDNYVGTPMMVQDWRKRTPRPEERDMLKNAPIVSKLHSLVDEYLNDDMTKTQLISENQGDSQIGEHVDAAKSTRVTGNISMVQENIIKPCRLETSKYIIGLEGKSELISSKNNAGHLPLHSAVRNGKLDCVERLLAQGSCSLMDERDCEGKTPLHLAVEGGFSPIIEALIVAGADLNIQTKDGKTCLHLVVTLWGSPEHPDKKVQTTNGFEQVVSRYPQYEPLTDNEKLLLYLLDKGASCTTFDASGDTPIHCTNTHRLWQLVVSGIPEEKCNDLLDELDVKSKRMKRTVQRVVGPEGDVLNLSRYGVHLTVPAGALGKDQDISMRLLETFPVPGIHGEEMMASFGVELKPGGLKFKRPVQIKLPHCASVVDTPDVKVVLHHFRGGELTSKEVTAGDLAEIPACTVREKELELHIDEFCSWFTFFKSSTGKQMMCIPYSNKASVHSADLRLYLAIDVKGVEKELSNSVRLRDAHKIGDDKPFFVQWSNGDVHVAVMNDELEEKTQLIRIAEIRSSTQTYRDFAELNTEHYENLTMRVFQLTETRIVCTNPLRNTDEAEALENVGVERSAQRVTQLQLIRLSEIFSHNKYTELCVRLGCSWTSADNKLATHLRVYKNALLEVLNEWNQRTRRNHRDKLIMVLENAEVAGLITEIFPDYVHEN